MAKNEHKLPQHVEKHPFGQLPYIDDDGFILFEGRAIARYIATKYANEGPKLIPTDFYFGQSADEPTVEKNRSSLDRNHEVFDKILSKQKYLAGDEVTLADLFVLPYATLLHDAGAGDLVDKRPNVKRWIDEISARMESSSPLKGCNIGIQYFVTFRARNRSQWYKA